MKAVVWTRYGPPDVLQLQEVEKPTPKDNEVLVRIYATTVTAGDCELRSLKFPIYLGLAMRLWRGLLRPRDTTNTGVVMSSMYVQIVGALYAILTVCSFPSDMLQPGLAHPHEKSLCRLFSSVRRVCTLM